MSDRIEVRTVRRWFYHGKGYASLTQAAKAQARRELWDQAFGPVENDPETGYNERPRLGEAVERCGGDKKLGAAEMYRAFFDAPDRDECAECYPEVRGGKRCWRCLRRTWIEHRTREIVAEFRASPPGIPDDSEGE